MKSKKKKFIGIKIALIFVCLFIIGFAGGFFLDKLGYQDNYGIGQLITKGIIFLIILVLTLYIHIIIHEAGHLVFGLLTGYKFVSFRVGTKTIVKCNNKFKLKKFDIRGTGGQCLMMPGTDDYKEMPYILYNIGGVLMNVLSGAISLIVVLKFDTNSIISMFLWSSVICAVYILITNGIPMKIGGIANDGYNLISIKKDDFMKYCFYTQLKVTGLLYNGVRYRDMPLEWFNISESADLNNPLVTTMKCFEAGYYHDRLEFDLAKKTYEELLLQAKKLISIYENEILCEMLFYEILDGNVENVKSLYTEQLRKYIKSTDCYISRKRLMYAYVALIENDKEKCEQMLKDFDKVSKTYPAKAEVESEIEVVEFIKNIIIK